MAQSAPKNIAISFDPLNIRDVIKGSIPPFQDMLISNMMWFLVLYYQKKIIGTLKNFNSLLWSEKPERHVCKASHYGSKQR